MEDGCCQNPDDTITSKCRLWLSHVSSACVRLAFPVCKRLAGGVEWLTEEFSSDEWESFLFIEASCLFGIKHSREGGTVVLTVCQNATWKRWERPEKQNPLFCWRVRGKHISLPLWKWRNWVRKRKVCCVRSSGITVWTCPNWYSVVSYWQPLCN